MITAEQLKNITERIDKLRGYLAIDKKLVEIANEEEKTVNPNFWNNPKEAEAFMKVLRGKKKWVDEYSCVSTYRDDLEVLLEFYKDELATSKDVIEQHDKTIELLENIEFRNMLSEEGDNLSAVLQITAGAGGTESCDWAEMLLRMYIMWSEKQGFKVRELNYQSGDVAGIKTATIEIEGDFAFGYLKGENGVHRLVRISPFDSNAKRHTSFASVWIYPQINDEIDIDIEEKDLRIDTYRASGAGGQHVNKTDSAIRITHLPTNTVVQCQNDRSQHRNRAQAMSMLRAKLYEIELKRREEINNQNALSKGEIGWGSQIRSYVLHPYQMVKDLRTNVEVGNTQSVLDGDLDIFVESALALKVGMKR
jgi:peptide chain release factor 2